MLYTSLFPADQLRLAATYVVRLLSASHASTYCIASQLYSTACIQMQPMGIINLHAYYICATLCICTLRSNFVCSADDFSDDTVIIAIQNERACNPVLRAQANGVLSLVDSYVDTLHVVNIIILALYPQLSLSCVYRILP